MVGEQSLSDWMSDEEYRLRQSLEQVSLVVETNFCAEEIREAQRRYGQAATDMLRRGHHHREIIKKYPALTLTTLVGHAALAYDHGAYWEDFWAELDRDRDPNFENALRHHLATLLDKFKLARFPELEKHHQYVMTLAMHAGIPVHCLGDLLRMVDDHLVRGREARGAALVEWLGEPGKEYRTYSLDVPVRNFIRYGGEFAVDILDRIIDVVDSVVADPGLLDTQLDSSTTGLPEILLGEVMHQLRDKPVKWTGWRTTRRFLQRQPVICYSIDDDQLIVGVPYPNACPESPWRVSFDGEVRQVYAERGWGASAEDHSPTPIPVPYPVRELLLWHAASEEEFSLSVVDKSDPLMTFTAEGSWIPRSDALKRDHIWAVYPSDSELVDPQSDKPVTSTATGTPAGWRGWNSAYVDLTKIDAIQLRKDGSFTGRKRIVRPDTAPTFDLGEPVGGCQSGDGRTVYSRRPWIMLPASHAQHPPSWRVRTRRLNSQDWLVNDTWDSADVPTCVDPFDDAPDKQLGPFEIVVTGPLGADARAVVFLAETLTIDFDRLLRFPAAHALSPTAALVGADEAFSISTAWLEFGPADRSKAIDISDGSDSFGLVIQPPLVEIRTGSVGQPASWRNTADVYAPHELAEDRFVAVRAPGAVAVHFVFVESSGESTHTEFQPRRKPGDVYEVSTQRFVDAARSAVTGWIVARIVTADGGTVDVTVLSVRPPRLCSGAHISGDQLIFHNLLNIEDLAAHIWCSSAPWLPPRAVSLTADTTLLPSDLVDVGPLLCEVFVDDPWAAVEPPRWPSTNAIRVNQPGWFSAGDAALTALSRFLMGEGPPPASTRAIPEVWSALLFAASDQVGVSNQRVQSALTRLLKSEPRMAFETLGNSTVPIEDKMTLLVRTELVNCSFATSVTLNELHADPWFGCMIEIADLPTLYRERHERRDERTETLAYLHEKGGDILIEILRTGKTRHFHEGAFGQNAAAMDSWPTTQVDAALDALRLVPGALLDADTRVAASIEAFRRRAEWVDTGCSESFAAQTAFAMAPIRRACPDAAEAITVRNDVLNGVDTHRHPWALVTLQSLTLAVLARLEAHGRISGQYLNSGMLETWTRLAVLFPRLVATDLLIAEALVVHHRCGDLIGDAL